MKKICLAVAMCTLFAVCWPICGSPAHAGGLMIGGYWENWNPPLNPVGSDGSEPVYYANDFAPFNLIYYSFLTLARVPNHYSPPDAQWDGLALYESMTGADVMDVMIRDNSYEWQRVKIDAMLDQCHATGKKFIWALGGWSDLTRTVSDAQIPTLVAKCVELLALAGDGIDFDWEHLSQNADIREQQRQVLGKIFSALRQALDAQGMSDKLIGYTTRFNAFWDNDTRPGGVTQFITDGEGIDVAAAITQAGSSISGCLDWINIMLYDVPPGDLGAEGGFTLDTYKMVLGAFAQYAPRSMIVMGFEPGPQAAGGVWEGIETDKLAIDHIKTENYGGVMFWAANEPGAAPTGVTGQNAQTLATYAGQGGAAAMPGIILQLLLGE